MSKSKTIIDDPEIVAISHVFTALRDLDADAQNRVLAYVAGKLKIAPPSSTTHYGQGDLPEPERSSDSRVPTDISSTAAEPEEGDLHGISPVARRWMTRNGLSVPDLSKLFSLGVDEIDLVAKTVPGKKKKERMRNVFLLRGVAAYLSAGAARFTHEQMKEASLHYDAFDAANFAVNFKSLAGEVSGSKETGYSLTARGLASATEMVKQLTQKTG